MNPPWPPELDAADPDVRRRRTRIAVETVIERIRPGTYTYPTAMLAYLVLVPHHGDTAVVVAATAVQLAIAVVRAVLYRRSTRGREVDPDRWRRVIGCMSALVIFLWEGFAAYEVCTRGLDAMAMLLVGGSFVLRASGTYAASPDLFVHGLWSRWTRAPLLIAPLLVGTRGGLALTVMFAGHFVYGELQARQLNAEFWRGIAATDSLAIAHAELQREIAIRQRAEVELRLAQKLESVGRLAAGIAHEINTPLQAMVGSLEFVGEGIGELLDIARAYQAAAPSRAHPELADELAYLATNLPDSLALANDCLDRTATIVRSVKTFAHPGTGPRSKVDLNRALETTLAVARHACVRVADVVTELGELPLVDGDAGELNQVFLNLIINAVDAMAPIHEASGVRGTLRVTTAVEAGRVCISIADTGIGIPDAIRDKIFDPFFTTKEPGKGTGQGLMIAHTVVTQRHGGELCCASTVGRGTTFVIRLPIAAPEALSRAA